MDRQEIDLNKVLNCIKEGLGKEALASRIQAFPDPFSVESAFIRDMMLVSEKLKAQNKEIIKKNFLTGMRGKGYGMQEINANLSFFTYISEGEEALKTLPSKIDALWNELSIISEKKPWCPCKNMWMDAERWRPPP